MRTHRKKPWMPRFPKRDIRTVRLHKNDEFSTLVADHRVGIQIGPEDVENPAVFWIDEEHVYCRPNWASWHPVRISAPEHFRLLRQSRLCTLHQVRIETQDSQEFLAPVHRVATLPPMLFAPAALETDGGGEDLYGERLRDATIKRLAEEIDNADRIDAMTFKFMELPGVPTLDLVASSDKKNVLFAVHPPETDPGFETGPDYEPEEDDFLFEPTSFNETIRRLVLQRTALREFFEETDVVLAVYDYPFMLERIRRSWQKELERDGIELVDEKGFEAFLRQQFPEKEEEEEDDDDETFLRKQFPEEMKEEEDDEEEED